MKQAASKMFFRVQSTGRDWKNGTFVVRRSPSGGQVVTINKKSYASAKKAAASVMSKTKQPAQFHQMYQNQIFDLLGAEGDDIEALTAYALYKRHKRRWAAKFEADYGKKPSSEDDAAFAKAVATDDQLERYKKDARDILIAFANQTVDDARAQISEEAITVRIEDAARSVTSQGALKNQIFASIISTGITTVFLIIVVIGLRLFGIDVVDGLNSLEPLIE